MSNLVIRDAQGRLRYWWCSLVAVPSVRSGWPYRRLRRVWFDHTWSNCPFMTPGSEMQLTAALFENFTIFDPADWIPAMLELAGLPYPAQRVSAANWGYEILDAPSKKLADVAIHYRDADGEGIIVVEAKKKGGALKPTDGDPASYLDLEAFAWAPRRQLVYLIDESDRAAVAAAVTDSYARSGILSWQQLGGLQNTLAQRLPCGEELRAFVAGAIQHQFLSLDILPSVLCADYLADEPSREEINARHPDKLTAQDWASSEWRLT